MQEPQETQVRALGGEDSLEEGMATHSSIQCLTITVIIRDQSDLYSY